MMSSEGADVAVRLRIAITKVLANAKELESPRNNYLIRTGKQLINKISENEQAAESFDKFCANLYAKLESLCDSCRDERSCSLAKGKLWCLFHMVCTCEIPEIWDNLFMELGISCEDQLLPQSVSQEIFEKVIVKHFSRLSGSPSTSTPVIQEVITLSKDELNVLQYVGGYVPHALLKRYKRFGKKYENLFECLKEMAVVGETDHLFEYTKEWISKVDRGGLFPLNNMTFLLFTELEKQVRGLLSRHMLKMHHSSDTFKNEVIKKTCDNEDVQFQWSLVCQCIDKEEDACWLLTEIVTLYVTIRGFSIAASWMESYKQEKKRSTKKSVELRKHLA